MALLLAALIGSFTAAGVWLLLRARTFDVIIGISLLSYAVNLFIFATGRPKPGAAPIVPRGQLATLADTADPLPQALVLTSIVISLALTALLLALAVRARAETDSDHVDGDEPRR